MVAAAAQKCLCNANVRIVRGFNSLEAGQDRLGGLDSAEAERALWAVRRVALIDVNPASVDRHPLGEFLKPVHGTRLLAPGSG